jgi:hypothetical protein
MILGIERRQCGRTTVPALPSPSPLTQLQFKKLDRLSATIQAIVVEIILRESGCAALPGGASLGCIVVRHNAAG